MTNFLSKLWPVLLAIYIISPVDAHPLFLDDLIASGVLFYIKYKNARRRQQFDQYQSNSGSGNNSHSKAAYSSSQLTLDEAYNILGIKKGSSLDEIPSG